MRKIKALIYALLGGMIAWGYWQRGDEGWAIFISLFTLVIMALTLSSIGRLKISWDEKGITLSRLSEKATTPPLARFRKSITRSSGLPRTSKEWAV